MTCDEVYMESFMAEVKEQNQMNAVILVEYTRRVSCRLVHVSQFD